MKYIFTLLFVLSAVTAVLAQKSNTTPVITRYYQFTGTIDKNRFLQLTHSNQDGKDTEVLWSS